jgi:NAD(P)-dependent dehydrogenase (short-subunit alcohol dehydrogenase family)
MRLFGSTFLITGGGSGLGEATARAFVAAGARVAIADVSPRGADVAKELGDAALYVQTDVTSEESVAATVEAAVKRFGGLNGAVNCAGIAIGQRVVGKEGPHKLADFARVINVNLIGTFNVIRLVAAKMAALGATGSASAPGATGSDGERGVIINTASCAAFEGQIGQAAYSASKAGVAGMTLPIARELARYGIRVVTIAPGTFDTPMMAGMSDAVRQSLAEQVPFPSRLGRPDEYAALAQHIVENQMLNGTVIRLDGALRMGAK